MPTMCTRFRTLLALSPLLVAGCDDEPAPDLAARGLVPSPAEPSPARSSAAPVAGRVVVKLDAALAAAMTAALAAGDDPTSVALPAELAALQRTYGVTAAWPLFAGEVSDAALRARLRELAAEGRQVDPEVPLPHLERVFVLAIDPALSPTRAAAHFGALPGVEYAEPLLPGALALVPGDPLYPQQWGPDLIAAPGAWDLASGAGQTIAVLDSGIDGAHPDLAGQVDPNGYDACSGALVAPVDGVGHGTHVAGIAGAAWNATGVAGMAPAATLLSVDVYAAGAPVSACVAAGLAHAASFATIANASVALHATSRVIEDAVQAAHAADVLVTAAAGNHTSLAMAAPANVEWALAIAAVEPGDVRASYSNTGVKLDVAAPGGDSSGLPAGAVLSTYPTALDPTGYRALSGTSMAAPHVAGLAALVRELAPGWSVEQVRSAIRLAALDKNAGSLPGFDDELGHGRVDAEATVLRALAGTPPPTANITVPKNDQHIRGKTKIFGYADTPPGSAGSYQVEWSTSLHGAYTPIGAGAIVGGAAPGQVDLGTVGPGSFPAAGRYVLRLTTRDATNGVTATDYNEIEVCGACTPLPPGGVAWWRFDRSTFPVAADSLGDNDGQYFGDAAPGPNGYVRDGAGFFGGAADVMTAHAVAPPSFYRAAVQAWIRRGGGGEGIIAAYTPDGAHGWELGLHPTGAIYFASNIQGGGPPHVVSSVAAANVYQWTHVAAVVEPQSGAALAPMKISLYVDGVPDNTLSFVMPSSFVPPATAPVYRVGNGASIVPGNPASMPFPGNIDEVQVFGAPLSAAQVAASAAARCGGSCP
ncbi:MAG: S8 family serine peptidase [Myxococcales bacterium]|nr:S8 family serine peptidase [Myxococcales bacterium]